MLLAPLGRLTTRRVLRPLLALGLVTTVASVAYAQVKIAVVDTQRAMIETEEGLRLQANLKKIFETKQAELSQKQKLLEDERVDIEKQQKVLSQEALQRRAAAWQQEAATLQQMFVQYNQEMQTKQSEVMQPLFQKTIQLIRRLATQEGYDIVVDKQAAPYVRSDLDLTDRIITMYNGGVAGEPAPAASGAALPKAPAAPKSPAAPKAP